MHLNALLISLLSAGTAGRKARQRRQNSHGEQPPAWLAGLSDHELRDLGYRRERGVSYRHLLWM